MGLTGLLAAGIYYCMMKYYRCAAEHTWWTTNSETGKLRERKETELETFNDPCEDKIGDSWNLWD